MAQESQPQNNQGNQVDLVKEIRRKNRATRRRRRLAALAGFLLLIAYFSGVFTVLVSWGRSWYESATIAFAPQAGYPVQTSLSNIDQLAPLSGGFVALGTESCVVYSSGGNRLRSIQSGYLRPAIAVGSDRYVLYQRAGTELRVETRTQTLYTKTFSSNILLAAISNNGGVAVVTESDRYLANLRLYTPNMTEQLSYDMTNAEGTPICMAYAPDHKTLAVATISASDGQMLSKLYLVEPSQKTVTLMASGHSIPLAIEWISKTKCLVIYQDKAVLYNKDTQVQLAQYDLQGQTVADYALYGDMLALLVCQGRQKQVVLVQNTLADPISFGVDAAVEGIALDDKRIYLVCEKQLITTTHEGAEVDVLQTKQKILDLLMAKQMLLFTETETTVFTPPTIPVE